MSIEAMKQALEALEYPGPSWPEARHKAAVALRERLAQPLRTHWEGCDEVHPECRKPRREWVGLTDEEVKALPQWFPSHETAAVLPLIRAIEAKLREKNT